MKLVVVTGLMAYRHKLRLPNGCIKQRFINADYVLVDRRRLRRAMRRASGR
jgi:hypothetical protein